MDSSREREDQINKIRKERGEITTDTTELKRILRNYYEEVYAKKFENVGEMDKFLEKYDLPKLNEKGAKSLNRPLTAEEIEAVIKKKSRHRKPWTRWFQRRILQSI